ncbi:putative cyclin-dependent serine/threonine-protein kinase DDB_G0272797/DDB_G0274007 [Diabrotica virgifera virgifera]|uniref:Cyclin-dependent serine/threonine-protein kinase DDB_G0272797/DDB_G0274007 n=1 Tax=Diabrotica virgifera virgifera TaxID=50390 RepID=A0A6P7H913_DIAVI|nr:putative cyclin-dependent serine/threonine-protein kinase DDB_G0272797/DDB_G0274007 [Diabrotica virgifera virgifera]
MHNLQHKSTPCNIRLPMQKQVQQQQQNQQYAYQRPQQHIRTYQQKTNSQLHPIYPANFPSTISYPHQQPKFQQQHQQPLINPYYTSSQYPYYPNQTSACKYEYFTEQNYPKSIGTMSGSTIVAPQPQQPPPQQQHQPMTHHKG